MTHINRQIGFLEFIFLLFPQRDAVVFRIRSITPYLSQERDLPYFRFVQNSRSALCETNSNISTIIKKQTQTHLVILTISVPVDGVHVAASTKIIFITSHNHLILKSLIICNYTQVRKCFGKTKAFELKLVLPSGLRLSPLLFIMLLGPVVRRVDSAIHRIVIFSYFLKFFIFWYNSD